MALAAAAVASILATGRIWSRLRRRGRLLRLTGDVTFRYARLLSVKQKQLVIHDGYGNYQLQPWIDHVDYFIENVVLREARAAGVPTRGAEKGTILRSHITRALLDRLQALDDAIEGPIADAEIISGEHYETLCRNLLQAQGWRVETTPATGDQGADLIAEAKGCRVVLQCKFYGKPVGNKAVQEAFSALTYHAGDHAAVVSNAAYTRSARQLAQTNGVILMHHDQLAELDRMILQAGARA
jgi:restriction system protein